MENYIKKRPAILCCALFAICLCVRGLEYFVIRTDETVIGENLIHKVFGILVLFGALKAANMTWREIGFGRPGAANGILRGLSLSIVCFALSYGAEMLLLSAQGSPAHIELYISGFSLTGTAVKHTGILFFLLCIVCNLINVWMEEGLFRGFFLKVISEKHTFMKANWIAALLFGVWHFVMPVRSFLNGEMELHQMLLLAVGYILLSGIMSVKWGLLYRMTGNLWTGLADHFFNNAVASNMLHVVTDSGTDEMQIVRIMLAQMLSFAFVAVLYRRKDKSADARLS